MNINQNGKNGKNYILKINMKNLKILLLVNIMKYMDIKNLLISINI